VGEPRVYFARTLPEILLPKKINLLGTKLVRIGSINLQKSEAKRVDIANTFSPPP